MLSVLYPESSSNLLQTTKSFPQLRQFLPLYLPIFTDIAGLHEPTQRQVSMRKTLRKALSKVFPTRRTDDETSHSASATKSDVPPTVRPLTDISNSQVPAIEPQRPPPRFKPTEIVTPRTIIPACFFRILSINWDASEETYAYTIKTLPSHGDHYQPDITRTVPEEVLDSQINIRKRHQLAEMEGRLPPSMLKEDNEPTPNLLPGIEIGDSVKVLVRSMAIDPFALSREADGFLPGTVVGINMQHGLWECFLVNLEKDRHTGRTLPCTERVLKLVSKGTSSKKKPCETNVMRVGVPGGRCHKTMRPALMRVGSEPMGVITWTAGKDAGRSGQLVEK